MPTAPNGLFQCDDTHPEINHRKTLNHIQDFQVDEKKHESGMQLKELEPEESISKQVLASADYIAQQDHQWPAPASRAALPQSGSQNGFLNGCCYSRHAVNNELCERFSFYGMRSMQLVKYCTCIKRVLLAVLTLYLVKILSAAYGYNQQTKNTATAIYSGFVMLCYFSPILGSILADGYIGKFQYALQAVLISFANGNFSTILWISLFYACGNVTLAVASSFNDASSVHPWLDFVGLIIIGLGTGGIKPCVQAFGGDQYRKGQERQLAQFFSIVYFANNLGGTITMFLTPIFRTQPCQGQESCYPLAFGVPAALMVVAVMFFVFGSYWYKKLPPEGNVFSKVAKVTAIAVKNKRTFETKRDHWLDHYMDSHNCSHDEECRDRGSCQKAEFINDIKSLLRILVVYVPLPIFHALYEQQGSTWVLQATQMNFEIAEGVYFLPDQMGVLNAILVMALIPTFQIIIYPLCGKIVRLTHLRKMSAGGVLAGVGYIVCMVIQFKIQPTLPPLPANGQMLLTVANYIQDCKDVQFVAMHGSEAIISQTIARNYNHMFELTLPNGDFLWDVDHGTAPCPWVDAHKGKLDNHHMTLSPNKAVYTIFTNDITDSQNEDISVIKVCKYGTHDHRKCQPGKPEVYKEFEITNRTSVYKDLKPGTWAIFLDNSSTPIGNFTIKTNGGIFSTTLFNDSNGHITHEYMRQAPDNTVSIMWQVPQIVVMSMAEVLFVITGNEFAYSQAPLSMKSVVMAFWLLTDSVGNVIILIISMVPMAGLNMAWIFLIYAGLMFAIMIIFMFIAYRYKYVHYVRNDK